DDVTAKLMDIIKVNNMLKTQVESGAGEHIITDFAKLLQYHIFTLCDNTIIGIPQACTKSKRPLKSIRERLKSKEGRLRGTLMGKRVDFCARSVIGGDPNLDTEQVGVPRSVALNLTFPERVTPLNTDWLKSLVANGPTKWPGARRAARMGKRKGAKAKAKNKARAAAGAAEDEPLEGDEDWPQFQGPESDLAKNRVPRPCDLGPESLKWAVKKLLPQAKQDDSQRFPEWMAAQRSMLEHFAKQSGDSSGAQPGEAPKAEQEEEWELFSVRRVEFQGRQVPLLLQNRSSDRARTELQEAFSNGPCALLAAANALLRLDPLPEASVLT
ncbi:unnamed protein product, partial [Effrenium voratum]